VSIRRREASKNKAEPLLEAVLCTDCFRRALGGSVNDLGSILTWQAEVPPELASSHEICPWCLSLYLRQFDHVTRWELARAGVRLRGGWESPWSALLKADLRKATPGFLPITAAVLANNIGLAARRGDLIVPVPISKSATAAEDSLTLATRQACLRAGHDCGEALGREKQRSTRASVAQIRKVISRQEYFVLAPAIDNIRGRRVMLVDDTATTGATIAGVANMLRSHGALVFSAVVLDRTISARLKQRLENQFELGCSHRVRR
jgi:hypothetical protein